MKGIRTAISKTNRQEQFTIMELYRELVLASFVKYFESMSGLMVFLNLEDDSDNYVTIDEVWRALKTVIWIDHVYFRFPSSGRPVAIDVTLYDNKQVMGLMVYDENLSESRFDAVTKATYRRSFVPDVPNQKSFRVNINIDVIPN